MVLVMVLSWVEEEVKELKSQKDGIVDGFRTGLFCIIWNAFIRLMKEEIKVYTRIHTLRRK